MALFSVHIPEWQQSLMIVKDLYPYVIIVLNISATSLRDTDSSLAATQFPEPLYP